MGKKIKQVLPTIIILIFNVKKNHPQTIAQPRSQGREERTLGTRLTIAHQKRITHNLNDGKKIFHAPGNCRFNVFGLELQ